MEKEKFISPIRVLRTQHGFKQTELAEKAKISQQKISRFELGKAIPTREELRAIRKTLLDE